VPRLPHKGFRSVSSPTESSSCLPRLAVGEAVSLEDKPIGPVEVEMPDLLGSDPIGERAALDPMHHHPRLHQDLERSPVAEVGPPSLGCFFSTRLFEIVIDKPRGATDWTPLFLSRPERQSLSLPTVTLSGLRR
jgi:hypothetical protein